MAAAIIAIVQVGALSIAVLVWLRTKGTWHSGAFAAYFFSVSVVAPVAGWSLATALARMEQKKPWRSWPIGAVTLAVLLSGEGFDEAGIAPWAPLLILGILSFVVGLIAFARTDSKVT